MVPEPEKSEVNQQSQAHIPTPADSLSPEKHKIADLIIDQIGEMNKKIKEKIGDMEKSVKTSTMDVGNLNKAIENYEERLSQIEKSLDKFIGLYELVTNQYNPFVKKPGEESPQIPKIPSPEPIPKQTSEPEPLPLQDPAPPKPSPEPIPKQTSEPEPSPQPQDSAPPKPSPTPHPPEKVQSASRPSYEIHQSIQEPVQPKQEVQQPVIQPVPIEETIRKEQQQEVPKQEYVPFQKEQNVVQTSQKSAPSELPNLPTSIQDMMHTIREARSEIAKIKEASHYLEEVQESGETQKIMVEDSINNSHEELIIPKQSQMSKEEFVAPLRAQVDLPPVVDEPEKTQDEDAPSDLLRELTLKIEEDLKSKFPEIEDKIIDDIRTNIKTRKELTPDKYFYLTDGRCAKSIKELHSYCLDMADDVFTHHVNFTRNDFANWIKAVFDDSVLADKIKNARSKEEIISLLGQA